MECALFRDLVFRDLEFNVLNVDFIESMWISSTCDNIRESKYKKKGGWFSNSFVLVFIAHHIECCNVCALRCIRFSNGKHPHYHIVSLSIQFTVWFWSMKFNVYNKILSDWICHQIQITWICMDIYPKILVWLEWMVKVNIRMLSKNQRCDLQCERVYDKRRVRTKESEEGKKIWPSKWLWFGETCLNKYTHTLNRINPSVQIKTAKMKIKGHAKLQLVHRIYVRFLFIFCRVKMCAI